MDLISVGGGRGFRLPWLPERVSACHNGGSHKDITDRKSEFQRVIYDFITLVLCIMYITQHMEDTMQDQSDIQKSRNHHHLPAPSFSFGRQTVPEHLERP